MCAFCNSHFQRIFALAVLIYICIYILAILNLKQSFSGKSLASKVTQETAEQCDHDSKTLLEDARASKFRCKNSKATNTPLRQPIL